MLCFKHKTAYEVRISDWSSDVCSSDLTGVSPELVKQNFDGLVNQARLDEISNILPDAPITSDFLSDTTNAGQIGRASCRERVCQYVSLSVVAVSLIIKTNQYSKYTYMVIVFIYI